MSKFNVIVATIISIIIPLFGYSNARAQSIDIRDRHIIIPNEQFNRPESVLVVPIFDPFDNNQNISSEEWYRGMFYYMISRMGFSDIPFHYVVSQTGEVYVGNEAGHEQVIPIVGRPNSIVIGYMADRSDNQINPRAFSSLESLILRIVNEEQIPLNNVQTSFVNYVKNEQERFVSLEASEPIGFWQDSINQIVANIGPFYNPVKKEYSIAVGEIELPPDAVNIDDNPVVRIQITNTGEETIYQGGRSELIAQLESGSRSKFFVNNLWASTSEAIIMEEGSSLRPGQTETYSFRLNVPLFFGRQAESFVIKNASGDIFADSKFSVALSINKPSQRVVEIRRTSLGYLRVRQSASTSSPEIARLSAGERYLVYDDLGNGWLKIRLDDGRDGWISSQFTRNI